MRLRYAGTALMFLILSGCQFAGSSLFPLRLAYIEKIVDVESHLQGPIDDITMSVLFNAQREFLFVLDQPPAENRLLIFDENLELLFSGTASAQGVAGEFGRLMMLAADFDFVVGNVSIAPGGAFGPAPPGPFLAADSRFGFSNFLDTNWIIDVTNDGVNFRLSIMEYDTGWLPGPTGQYDIYPYDSGTTVSVEDALYLDDTDEIIVVLHFDPGDAIFLFSFDGADFPDSLTVTTNLIQDGIYVQPLPESVENVMRDSVSFTVDGIVYYDQREKRLKRIIGDESNLRIETERGKLSFAFSLLGDTYYYVDPARGELYKMGTWW